MVDASRYWMQVSYYRQYYPDDQILVLFFEEFKQDPGSVLRTCFEILDADPDVFIDGVNTGFYSLLAAGFHPDVRVHAFEPVPDIAAMLVENLKLNGFAPEAVRVNRVAVGSAKRLEIPSLKEAPRQCQEAAAAMGSTTQQGSICA